MNYIKQMRTIKRSALKGFTLIELIVVMAIIAILASMLTIMSTLYIRDAKMEAADENAQIASKAIQKVLTEYEIQNVDLKAAKYIYQPPAPGTKQTRYLFSGGLATSSGPSGSMPGNFLVSTDPKTSTLDSGLSYTAITKYLPNDFQGAFIVQINDFEYSVIATLYTDTKESGVYDTFYLKQLAARNLLNNGAMYLENHTEQEAEYKAVTPHGVGCYPYKADVNP